MAIVREYTRCTLYMEGDERGTCSIDAFAKDNKDDVSAEGIQELRDGITIHGGGGAAQYWEVVPSHPQDFEIDVITNEKRRVHP